MTASNSQANRLATEADNYRAMSYWFSNPAGEFATRFMRWADACESALPLCQQPAGTTPITELLKKEKLLR